MSLDTSPGSATATAYASVAEFKAYQRSYYSPSDPATDEEIEQALARATRYLDGRYRARFLGYRTNGFVQALEWPRTGVVLLWDGAQRLSYGSNYSYGYYGPGTASYYAPGTMVAVNAIPQPLKDATCEAAIRELASPGSLTPDQTPSKRVIRQSVGPISQEFANVDDTRICIPIIDELLAPLLVSTSAYSATAVRA